MRLVLSAVVVLAACAALTPTASAQNLSGRRAPSFALPDTKFEHHDILDYRGKWLLIQFLDTTCPHCKALSKTLEQLKKRLAGKVEVVGIVIPPENMASVAAFRNANQITYPVLFDSSQVAITYFKATPQNRQMALPHLFAVDPNGWLARDWGQARAEDPSMVKEIEALVNSGKK